MVDSRKAGETVKGGKGKGLQDNFSFGVGAEFTYYPVI